MVLSIVRDPEYLSFALPLRPAASKKRQNYRPLNVVLNIYNVVIGNITISVVQRNFLRSKIDVFRNISVLKKSQYSSFE